MSRRDYVSVARVLAASPLSRAQRAGLIDQLGAVFAADNAKFDLERFRRAATAGEFDDRGDGICLTCDWAEALHCAGVCPASVH